jgi:molybdate transport system ATP-binding protein
MPRSSYVADLVGLNLITGTASGTLLTTADGVRLTLPQAATGSVFATIHPRSVALHRRQPEGTPRNVWPGEIDRLELVGDRIRVEVRGSPNIVAEVTPAAVAELGLESGTAVWVSVKATEVNVYAS